MNTVNTKVSMDQMVLKSLYFRYKEFITPVSVILVCLITFWLLIVPQIQNWFSMQDQIATDAQQLEILKQNLNAVTLMNDVNLDSLLQTASSALPTEKDFAAIVNALQTSALHAGTQLGNYNFQIGDLSDTLTAKSSIPFQENLPLTISLLADLPTTEAFVKNLRNQLPLSDVTSVTQDNDGTVTVTVVFYYASLPKISFNDSVPLQVVNGKDEAFLKSLEKASGNANSPSIPVVTSPQESISPSPVISPSLAPSGNASLLSAH